jgi:REP element-mobilizing transposase RayT
LRIEYEEALYHVMNRGDRREAIYLDDEDRERFLETLGETCAKTGWRVQAWCLMSNHFHLVLETPQANLAVGMKWLLGTYTQRFNRRHRHWGHLFGGRYKAQMIDGRSPAYLRTACDYVHLNPARAGIIAEQEPLETYAWSSYPAYLRVKERPDWLAVERLLGEHGLQEDTAGNRREFSRRMEQQRQEPEAAVAKNLQRGWKHGAEDFADWLADKLARRGHQTERAAERRETDEALARRIIAEGLSALNWTEADLSAHPKGHPVKVEIARRLRENTPMTGAWIASQLQIGSASYLSTLLASVNK